MSHQPFKLALGMNLQSGPYGGGNFFGRALEKYLIDRENKVVFALNDDDIDIIMVTEPRKNSASCAFDGAEALKYLRSHPKTHLIYRVNECDEKRGRKIKLLNQLIARTADSADHVVFISSWLQKLFSKDLRKKSSIIHNGADTNIFHNQEQAKWQPNEPLRIVTHHWSPNWHKGWDVYEQLDQLIGGKYKGKVEFTYIGNPYPKIKLQHSSIKPPVTGQALAEELKQHHIYLTASMNEPAGMHHIEGALCGLPLLYRNSGALPEYCQNFGIGFNDKSDFLYSLEKIQTEYQRILKHMPNYSHTAQIMCEQYYQLFKEILDSTPPQRSNLKNWSQQILILTTSQLQDLASRVP